VLAYLCDGLMLLLSGSSGNVVVQLMLGVRKDKPQRRVAENSRILMEGGWDVPAGGASSYWLRDLTSATRPHSRYKRVFVYLSGFIPSCSRRIESCKVCVRELQSGFREI
jgi:hypothetical protein